MNTQDWMVWAWVMTMFFIIAGAVAVVLDWVRDRKQRQLLPDPEPGAIVGQIHKPWM